MQGMLKVRSYALCSEPVITLLMVFATIKEHTTQPLRAICGCQ